MGTHGANVRPRALPPARRAVKSESADSGRLRKMDLALSDWPVARRLFAVIVAALLMGVAFGGLRVADAETSANQFSRTLQLAKLSAQLLGVSQDLQNERDATDVALITDQEGTLPRLQAKTNSDLVPVRTALQQVLNGGFPATVVSDASTVNNALSAENIGNADSGLHGLFNTALPDGDVVGPDYEAVLADIATFQAQVSLGITDQSLNNDVQTLGALAQVKELTSQQLATFDQALANTTGTVTAGDPPGTLPFAAETSMQLAYDEELSEEAVFQSTATQAENAEFDDLLGPGAAKLDGETESDNIDQALFAVVGGGAVGTDEQNATGVALQPFITEQLNNSAQGVLASVKQTLQADKQTASADKKLTPDERRAELAELNDELATETVTNTATLKAAWDTGVSAKLAALQTTEQFVAGNVVTRATQLHQAAQGTALVYIIITVVVLLVVLLLALLVARSLVLPLRRLRAGALDVASVQLPERVRLLSEDPETAATMQVAPINVISQDEIGQVARAFDQVHSEAVRLAGEQALLRSSFNAMFVNLSRRSQTLIERLARMIDILEQNEDDPDRLGSLFSMDHLVTRMRRNSENLLLLAGHDNPRKWSEAVPLADVARAATSEIEQYNRVTLSISPGVSVSGQAVSDVVHLLAELIENATMFSPKDTQIQVGMQELSSGGVLIEVIDKGIGVSEARLTDMNWRLDNPPTIDVSVSRHMGLFAVARLAERHRVRVRLRPASPQGLSALVWLPEGVIERRDVLSPATLGSGQASRPAGVQAAVGAGALAAAGARAGAGDTVTLAPAPQASPANGNGGNGHGKGNPALEGRTASGWFRGGHDGASGSPAVGAPAGPGSDFPPSSGRGRDTESSFADTAFADTAFADTAFTEPANSEPSYTDQTASGLPVRVPKANMPPGTGGAGAASGQGGLPTRTVGNGRTLATGSGSASGGKTMPKRSPEHARSRLAGFQRGTRRAEEQRGSADQAPRAGEGTLS